MTKLEFSNSLSRDNYTLTQDQIIIEIYQEIIKEELGEDTPYYRMIKVDIILETIKEQILKLLKSNGIDDLNKKNKEKAKRILKESIIKKSNYYLDDKLYYDYGKYLGFDFSEESCWGKSIDKVSVYGRKVDNGEVEYLVDKEIGQYSDFHRAYATTKTINTYNENGFQISTRYQKYLPGHLWNRLNYIIKRNPGSIPGLYSLEANMIAGALSFDLGLKGSGTVYKTAGECTIELPEGDPSVIPDFKTVLLPLFEKKLEQQKSDQNNVEEQVDTERLNARFKNDCDKYPRFKEVASKMYDIKEGKNR